MRQQLDPPRGSSLESTTGNFAGKVGKIKPSQDGGREREKIASKRGEETKREGSGVRYLEVRHI